MLSATAISYELDDSEAAARELAASIKEKLSLKKNSLGILFCDADCDGAALSAELEKLLGITVGGMTTLAELENSGCLDGALVLIVLTADDCFFSPAVSTSLIGNNYEEKMVAAYEASAHGVSGFGEKPAFIFAFCPSGMSFSGDKYPDVLSKAAPNVPIIGGVSSDDYDYKRARVFLSGKAYLDSLVLISVWGRAKPIFSLRHVTSRFAERIRRVVRAEGNKVFTVGDETFVKYLEGFGLKTNVPDILLAFNSYPMMLTREGGDEIPLMRHISALDPKDGSGTFLGDVPAGSLANICLVSKKDVMAACRESMEALLEETQKQGDYQYSTIFCISCCGRAMILGSDSDAEGQILSELLPKNLNLAGAYCLGEICPARYKDGEAANRFHNCSITFCAI
ncbi:FIST signal transduction protein [Leadbettera azotonutricia]|uniref:FIST C-domain domain-containing protein n=1 Tax=Leadbettera azotonutricia (strain ATCC BAA-888 / DSM 13862 / ZAS-9) TaxID=545695 RepID=F5YA27_LEAAZ|nr:FIST C-terminal domain-containing protein [Leadbettera azotonutricia]AEF81928.1 conserved hypothetical protein [Leadbettera azotonutricia ZAS-9]